MFQNLKEWSIKHDEASSKKYKEVKRFLSMVSEKSAQNMVRSIQTQIYVQIRFTNRIKGLVVFSISRKYVISNLMEKCHSSESDLDDD